MQSVGICYIFQHLTKSVLYFKALKGKTDCLLSGKMTVTSAFLPRIFCFDMPFAANLYLPMDSILNMQYKLKRVLHDFLNFFD